MSQFQFLSIPTPSKSPIDFLCQKELRGYIEGGWDNQTWIPIFCSWHDNDSNGAIFCGLVNNLLVSQSLQKESWDLSLGAGRPGCVRSTKAGEQVTEYKRFGPISKGIEPFVLKRSFHGIKPEDYEILEEFRLFHNLYHDPNSKAYKKIDDSGEEHDVIRYEGDQITKAFKVTKLELRQFLAIKEMHLAVFFVSNRFSGLDVQEIPVFETLNDCQTEYVNYHFAIAKNTWSLNSTQRSFSRLLGKRLIPPLPKEKSGIWPFNQDQNEEFHEFIIGSNQDGEPVSHTCDPNCLSDHFCTTASSANYLTPVFFRREVLQKYYQNSQKYSVETGFLRCRSLWGMSIDNDHAHYVIAYLGDLGRDLPEAERTYWKSFNVIPDGTISQAAFKRDFLAEFTEPGRPDFLFKYRFSTFLKMWEKEYGWPLFKRLNPSDQYAFSRLRVPIIEDQSEFDDQILGLTKVLIDSINEAEIAQQLSSIPEGLKGIGKLKMWLDQKGYAKTEDTIQFFRDLQDLRSNSAAHRKGRSYEKVANKFGLPHESYCKSFENILVKAVGILGDLENEFLK